MVLSHVRRMTRDCPSSPRSPRFLGSVVAMTLLSACAAGSPSAPLLRDASSAAAAPTLARRHPAPVVLILMENHSYSQIVGNASAPFMNGFAHRGELFTGGNLSQAERLRARADSPRTGARPYGRRSGCIVSMSMMSA
jgi:hypothetical protein